jgi:dihydrofolate reductase
MSTVFAEITMSLDGYVAGEGITIQQPMGYGGIRLHEWILGKKTLADKKLVEEYMNESGAFIVGNRTYATAIPDAWGNQSPFPCPAFVVCHQKPSRSIEGFIYCTGPIEETLTEARRIANSKKVCIMGGASIIQQYLQAGLVEELNIHIAPLLLCQGVRLFDNIGRTFIGLEQVRVVETPAAIHVKYSVN